MIRKIIREEIKTILEEILGKEDIQEISRDTLISYLAKASNDSGKSSEKIKPAKAYHDYWHNIPTFSQKYDVVGKGKRAYNTKIDHYGYKKQEDTIKQRTAGIKKAKQKLYTDHGIDVGSEIKKKIQNMYKK